MSILIQKHLGFTEITLNWPEVRNALGPLEGHALLEALERETQDPDIAAVVISANGKAFCAGGNLPAIAELAVQGEEAVRNAIYGAFQGVMRCIHQSPIPVITAVNGAATGFGCDLALACHISFIGSHGWLAQGWARAGLIPATGGLLYASQRGGRMAPWRLLLADRIDSNDAERWGLGIACEDARSAALEAARRLATLPQPALRALTRLTHIDDPDEHLQQSLDAQVGLLADPAFGDWVRKLLCK